MNEYLKIKQQEETEKNNSTSPDNTSSGAYLSTQFLMHVFILLFKDPIHVHIAAL